MRLTGKNSRDHLIEMQEFNIRPARESDSNSIKSLIKAVQINPIGLDWRNFIIATDSDDRLIGCGQIKSHQDGSKELASIAVLEEWRNRNVASTILLQLIGSHQGPLYLTCRSALETFYQRFGFNQVPMHEMPPYFRRISRLVRIFNKSRILHETLLVMKLDARN